MVTDEVIEQIRAAMQDVQLTLDAIVEIDNQHPAFEALLLARSERRNKLAQLVMLHSQDIVNGLWWVKVNQGKNAPD